MDLKNLEANYQSSRQAMSAQMTQQQNKKPWWTSLISELGGAGGAAGGAAAGATIGSVVPVVGTVAGGLIGAAAGGFLGGTGGRLAENKIRDNKFNVGSALGEGATDALFSGVAAGNDIRKGVKAAKSLSTVTQGIDNPQALLQAPDKVGLIQSVGKSLKTGASGYGIGAKSSGQAQLTASGSDAVDQTLKTLKIPATAPETQARLLDSHLNNIGNLLTERYSKANVPITTQEINNLGSNILGRVANTGGLSEGAKKFALDEAQKLSRVGTDVNKVWQYTKDLSRNSTNFGANADAKLVDKEAAARIILDQTRGFLNGKVPGAAESNNLYHGAKDAQSFILDAARDKGGGLIQRMASSAPVKTGEAKVGSLLENMGKYSAGTGGPASMITQQLKVQSPGALLRGASGLNEESQSSQPAASPQSLLTSDGTPQDLLGNSAATQPEPQTGGPSLDSLRQAVSQDLQATGGKNINNLMQLAQLYGIVDSSGNPAQQTSGPSIGKISAQQYGLAQSGAQSLQQLTQLLGSDPSLATKNATPGQGIPLIGNAISNATGASDYHSLADNVLSSLIHLQTGATATKEEITSAKGQLPGPNDDPATRQRKLQTLLGNFAPFLGSNQGGGQDLLSQMNGAQ